LPNYLRAFALTLADCYSPKFLKTTTSYLGSWSKETKKEEPKLIATASTEAFRRFNALMGDTQPEASSEAEGEGSTEAEA
jgi:hypothetical protein